MAAPNTPEKREIERRVVRGMRVNIDEMGSEAMTGGFSSEVGLFQSLAGKSHSTVYSDQNNPSRDLL